MQDFRELQSVRLLTIDATIAKGTYIDEDCIIRCDNHGFLNDDIDDEGNRLPALETRDGSHREFWTHGLLNSPIDDKGDYLPAVVDVYDNYSLWFVDGKEYPPML